MSYKDEKTTEENFMEHVQEYGQKLLEQGQAEDVNPAVLGAACSLVAQAVAEMARMVAEGGEEALTSKLDEIEKSLH